MARDPANYGQFPSLGQGDLGPEGAWCLSGFHQLQGFHHFISPGSGVVTTAWRSRPHRPAGPSHPPAHHATPLPLVSDHSSPSCVMLFLSVPIFVSSSKPKWCTPVSHDIFAKSPAHRDSFLLETATVLSFFKFHINLPSWYADMHICMNVCCKRKWQPIAEFLSEESHGQRSLESYSPWDRRVGPDWSDLACTHVFVCVYVYVFYLLTFYSFFKDLFFFDDHFLKFSLNLLHFCFCFMSWVCSHRVCMISAPRPETKPAPLALEGEVLTTGPQGSPYLRISLARDSSTLSCLCSRIPGPPPTS